MYGRKINAVSLTPTMAWVSNPSAIKTSKASEDGVEARLSSIYLLRNKKSSVVAFSLFLDAGVGSQGTSSANGVAPFSIVSKHFHICATAAGSFEIARHDTMRMVI